MSQDEITVMDGGKCILQLRGVRPFLSDKYDITKHKNYKLLEDHDKRNAFDVEKYLKRKDDVKLKSDMVVQTYKMQINWQELIQENYQLSKHISSFAYGCYNK